MRGKLLHRLGLLVLPVILLLSIFAVPAYAAEDTATFSDNIWRNGRYDSTLGDMAGRRLYVYGIVDSFIPLPEGGTDSDVVLCAEEEATRLETALYLYRILGTNPEGECPFTDVPGEYSSAVTWLYEAGVTKGIGNNLYGLGSITEHQLLVMLSRYFGWEAEDKDSVFSLADSLGILPLGPDDGVFTYGELYQVLAAMIDRFCPGRCAPVRPEMSIPREIDIVAESYEDALAQIKASIKLMPDMVSILLTTACSQEDLDAFRQNFDYSPGSIAFPIIGAFNRTYLEPYFLSVYSDQQYRLWLRYYSDAYAAAADALDWLRVYEDEAYSKALRDFEVQYLSPLKEKASAYERIAGAHDILCSLASYDYTEYLNTSRPEAHDLIGFMSTRKVVCDGYAKTFQWMLYYLGIDSYEVIGRANGELHAWNKVLLDGTWYNVDACWDDGGYYRYYFLRSDDFFEWNLHGFTDSFSKTVYPSPSNY